MELFRLKIKPLSANEMHLGRKTDSAKYRKWSAQAGRQLPDLTSIDWTKPIKVHVDVLFRRRSSDLDNIWKPLLDMLQRHIPDFNDNKVVRMSANKFITTDDDEVGYFIQVQNCSERSYEDYVAALD
jgi:Holliday junction resolvase RusA-like endonuclease